MRHIKKIYCLFFAGLIFTPSLLIAQINETLPATNISNPKDSTHVVEILRANKLEMKTVDDTTSLQILSGNVKLKQGNTLFDCDSCVINHRTNIFEAFGHVHINDGDTSNTWSDYLKYLMDKKVAFLKGNVRLTDGKGTLTTPDLEYDVDTKIGIYKNGGKVVNEKKTILTSQEGYYYTDLKDVYFKKNVVLTDPAYHLTTDSLLYNTENGTTRFIANTYIKDSSGRTIETNQGFYNLQTGQSEFGNRPKINDGKLFITGDDVVSDDSTGIIHIKGKGVMIDTSEGRTVKADEILINKKTNSFLATIKPLMIVKQDADSIFIAADTLFSARLSDWYAKKDSSINDTIKSIRVASADEKDSTDRFLQGFHHVRIFSDSLQAVCDSLFYSSKDSVFRLFTKPVIWSKESQISGDTILLYTKNKKADHMRVFENSFLVNQVGPEIYNQIKSSRMYGYFKDGAIDSVHAKGFAECIYYIQDQDSAFTGVNQSTSDAIDIYFYNQELHKVVFRSDVTGTLWPIRQKDPKEMRLKNFQWLNDRRPKTKFELME